MRSMLRAILAHPKTSAAGLAALVAIGYAVVGHPQLLTQPEVWAAILAALGLLASADGRADTQRAQRWLQGETSEPAAKPRPRL